MVQPEPEPDEPVPTDGGVTAATTHAATMAGLGSAAPSSATVAAAVAEAQAAQAAFGIGFGGAAPASASASASAPVSPPSSPPSASLGGLSALSAGPPRVPVFSPIQRTIGRAAVLNGPASANGPNGPNGSAAEAAEAMVSGAAGSIDTGDVDFAMRATGSIGALLDRLESVGLGGEGEGKIELGEMDEFD